MAIEKPFDPLIIKPLYHLRPPPRTSSLPRHIRKATPAPTKTLSFSKDEEKTSHANPLDSKTALLCEILNLDTSLIATLSPTCREDIIQEAKLSLDKWPDLDAMKRLDVLYATAVMKAVNRETRQTTSGKSGPVTQVSQRHKAANAEDLDARYGWWQLHATNSELDLPSKAYFGDDFALGEYEDDIMNIAALELEWKPSSDDGNCHLAESSANDRHNSTSLPSPDIPLDTYPACLYLPKFTTSNFLHSGSIYPNFPPWGGIVFVKSPMHEYELKQCKFEWQGMNIEKVIASCPHRRGRVWDSGDGKEEVKTGDWEMIVEFDEELGKGDGEDVFSEWKVEAGRQGKGMGDGYAMGM